MKLVNSPATIEIKKDVKLIRINYFKGVCLIIAIIGHHDQFQAQFGQFIIADLRLRR